MSPITPVSPLAEAIKSGLSGLGAKPPVTSDPALVKQFQALMQRVENAPAASGTPGHNVVGEVIRSQQADLQRIESHMQRVIAAMPSMGPEAMTMASMELSREITLSNVKLQVATAVTQSSNKSLQTLMKNQ